MTSPAESDALGVPLDSSIDNISENDNTGPKKPEDIKNTSQTNQNTSNETNSPTPTMTGSTIQPTLTAPPSFHSTATNPASIPVTSVSVPAPSSPTPSTPSTSTPNPRLLARMRNSDTRFPRNMQAHAGNLLERPLVRSRIPGDMSPTVFRMLTVRTLTMIVSSFLIVISLIDVLTRHAHCIQKASIDEASGLGKFSGESAEIGENFGSQNGSDTNPTKSPNITDSIIYRNGLDYYKTKNNEGIYKTNREQMFFRGTTSNDPINCDKTGQRTQSLIAQFEFKHIFQIIAGVMAYTGSQKAIANWLLPILVLSTFKTIRLSADTAMEITTYLHKYLAESGKDDFMKSKLEAEDGGPPVVTTRFQYDMNYNRNASLMTIFVYICQMILVIYVTYIIWSCYRHLRYLELRDRYGNSLGRGFQFFGSLHSLFVKISIY